ncbi:hypothetical protein DFH08DRAFT_812005 [Mycena albidolilacea]|uniref:Uncharacterized protein n=1 Tax=Mycena albidolilacea TaxID=1033008 RepID=A0AAD7EP40_9AGAR|nr:hypothetical protein DFH08DRAFT_812005 [Mycena albidolilacea]
MVFQNLGLGKMNEALHQQEEKALTDRAKLFKGKAQCLSSDDFHCAVVEVEETRKAKAAGKEANKLAQQWKKAAQEEVKRKWVEMKREHIAAVEIWSAECEKLPKLGKKPVVPIIDNEDMEQEDNNDDA